MKIDYQYFIDRMFEWRLLKTIPSVLNMSGFPTLISMHYNIVRLICGCFVVVLLTPGAFSSEQLIYRMAERCSKNLEANTNYAVSVLLVIRHLL